MSGLEKATLTKLSNDRKDTEVGDAIPVQFNPSSLKLTLSNNTEGGQTTGRSQRQFTGNSSTELAFDLVFDTADEDDGGGGPRSVRLKTAAVEQFVLPQGSGKKRKSPPRVKFHWGELVIKGVITSVALDFDLFAPDGTPLRAKMGISIKEQDAKYELLQSGPGSSGEGGAPAPGEGNGAGPGTKGGGANDPRSNRTALALGGESVADFTARVGLDPGAWRGLAAGLEGTLSLSAGLEIDFNASIGAGVGIGVNVGVEADLGVSLEASLGLESSFSLSAGVGAGASASASAGFALSATGGVTAAIESVKIVKAQAAAVATVKAFAAPAVPVAAVITSASSSPAVSGPAAAIASTRPTAGAGEGTAMVAAVERSAAAGPGGIRADRPAAGEGPSAPRAYAPPRADARAVSFGFGIPLRPRVTGAVDTSHGVVALQPYGPAREVPSTRDPTTPPWRMLPPRTAVPKSAGSSEKSQPICGQLVAGTTPFPAASGLAKPTPGSGGSPGRGGCGCGEGRGGR